MFAAQVNQSSDSKPQQSLIQHSPQTITIFNDASNGCILTYMGGTYQQTLLLALMQTFIFNS